MPSVRIQCYVPLSLADDLRRAAAAKDVSTSSLVRDLIHGEVARHRTGAKGPMSRGSRDMLYLTIGMDALLAAHDNRELRAQALAAYRTKVADREAGR